MTDEEWAKFKAGFASAKLFAVVDCIDALRGHLNDGDRHAPPEIRTDALYYNISEQVSAQLNVENVFNTRYYLYAHSNNNITPRIADSLPHRSEREVLIDGRGVLQRKAGAY